MLFNAVHVQIFTVPVLTLNVDFAVPKPNEFYNMLHMLQFLGREGLTMPSKPKDLRRFLRSVFHALFRHSTIGETLLNWTILETLDSTCKKGATSENESELFSLGSHYTSKPS